MRAFLFGVPPGFHGEPCADFSRCGKIFSKSLKIISEKYFSRHIGATERRGERHYWQRCARVSAAGRKNQGGRNGLVAGAYFAEGWLEGDQLFILGLARGRSPLARGVTHMGSASVRYCLSSAARQRSRRDPSRLFRCRLSCPALPGRCPVPEEEGENASPHMVSRPRGAMLLIAVSGFPVLVPANLHQPFSCLARGHWGKRGGARDHTVCAAPLWAPASGASDTSGAGYHGLEGRRFLHMPSSKDGGIDLYRAPWRPYKEVLSCPGGCHIPEGTFLGGARLSLFCEEGGI